MNVVSIPAVAKVRTRWTSTVTCNKSSVRHNDLAMLWDKQD